MVTLLFAVPVGVIAALIAGPVVPVAWGGVIGLLAGIGAGTVLGRTQRGGSNSHLRVRSVKIFTAGAGVLLGAVVAAIVCR